MYLIFKVDFRDDCFWEENDWSIVLVPVTISMFLYFDAAAAAKLLHSCPTLCDPIDEPTRLCCPWDSPGKNTGVGCHFLLQCMKVKSESEVTQSCPTLHDPMDSILPASSNHGIFQARVLEWVAIAFSDTLMRDLENYCDVIWYGISCSIKKFSQHLSFANSSIKKVKKVSG